MADDGTTYLLACTGLQLGRRKVQRDTLIGTVTPIEQTSHIVADLLFELLCDQRYDGVGILKL